MIKETLAPLPTRAPHRLASLFRPGPRLVDEIECAASVLLAIVFAHLLGGQHVFWAAFAGYLVMRGHVSETLLRGVFRVLGAAIGAGLAVLLIPAARESLPLAALFGALVGGATLYQALTSRHAYAWVLVGITFELTMVNALEHRDQLVHAVALTWVLQTAAGTLACVIVSALSTLTARRFWPGTPFPAHPHASWHGLAARHAVQAAIALAFVPWLSVFEVPGLAQSAITILLVMIVPLSSLGVDGLSLVNRRILLRAAGCLAGCALSALVLFVAQGSMPVLIAGTVIGLMIGRHIENGVWGIPYFGIQFTLAVLTALVPDSHVHATIDLAVGREEGILLGIAIVWPVLLAWHLAGRAVSGRWQAVAGRTPPEQAADEQLSTD